MKTNLLGSMCVTMCAGLGLVACGDANDPELVGTAQIAIAQVPSDVSCIQISAVGATRSTQREFDVSAGQSSLLSMQGIPTGNVSFSGLGFSVPCASVTSSSVAPWVSDPTVANVPTTGLPAQVKLVMRRNGSASVTVDFQDDVGTGGTGGTGGTTGGTGGTTTGGTGGTTAACGDGIVSPGEFCFPGSPTEQLAAGSGTPILEAADFDGNGSQDLESLTSSGQIRLFRNQNGALTEAALTTAPQGLVAAATGNFLQTQGQQTVALTLSGTLLLLDQSLLIVSQTNTGVAQPRAVATGDFDADGRSDVVVVGSGSSVSVLRGQGGGLFAAPIALSGFGPDGSAVAVGDINGDSFDDIVTTNQFSQSMSVGTSLGGVLFNVQQLALPVPSPSAIALADVNGDGRLDAVVASSAVSTVSVLAGDGVSFAPIFQQAIAPFADIAIGDFNRDGRADLVGADPTDGFLVVVLGDGTGAFGAGVQFQIPQVRSVVAADFNGDTVSDFGVAASPNVSIWLSTP